jgi:hypothetical protein
MKKLTIFAITMMVFFSIGATPIPEKNPGKNANKSADGFSFIRTHRQGKGAVVSWSFSTSNASGFAVQRTYEDPTDPASIWVDICDTPCNSSRSYKTHDDPPYPGVINYRVMAVMSDGNSVLSDVSTIKITSH